MLSQNKCEKCGRNMGNIDEPICHQCEVEELDAIENAATSRETARLAENRKRIMSV